MRVAWATENLTLTQRSTSEEATELPRAVFLKAVMRKLTLSWLFLGVSVALGIYATYTLNYDQNKVVLYFLLPYFALTTAMQYIWPEVPNEFEPGEVWTEIGRAHV